MTARLEGILLAAGESRRMGYPKPLLKIDSRTFVEKIAASMLEVVPRLVIVLGAHATRIRTAIPSDERIVIVENSNYMSGQLSSLKAGMEIIGPTTDAILIQLGDHPMVRGDSYRAVADSYQRARNPIVIARYAGRRGHPLIFDRSVFAELRAVPEGEGARYVVNADASRVLYVDLDDPGINLDLDTPDDLARAGVATPPGPK